jgi:hypothetical protein
MYYANTTTTPFTNANVAVGYEALKGSATPSNNTGNSNTAIGYQAIASNSSGSFNTALGDRALYLLSTGSSNAAFGERALFSVSSGTNNTAIGHQALYNSTDSDNTAVGRWALYNLTSGNGNTVIGDNGWPYGTTSYSNYTGIGYAVGSGVANPSNRVEIGNTSVSWIGGQVGWSTYSDDRIKDDVKEKVPGLDFVMKLKPVTYNLNIRQQNQMGYREKETEDWPGKYDIEQKRMTGFLAQEVAEAARESNYDFSGIDIPENENELFSLRYAEFVVPLVKAVQEQQVMIEALKSENQLLKSRIEALEK